ncbi:pirin family protein [Sulfurirhabdus autotrophica]|uniref:Quercetin 2,3-dioxygenase n=1 Tax=Sulfurirhabdus autotrophica TaxID=1706046 RepID=A0A4R3XS88_9PROT|nr:pirin family protein [Sulfurirhabdus autotrophica]TCV80232.1 hypothetical protein EDC63_12921 [Sulfurirhabdus autotrophica]
MIKIRKSTDRGHANHGWLDSWHSFSFAEYYDPEYMGFGSLRVINDDRIAAGAGFPTHPHRDMEIITYIMEGALEHKDSMGTGSVIRPGDVQRMTAGTGITHSEFNASETEPIHLLQIWIQPNQKGLTPGYEQKTFTTTDKQGHLRLVASPDGRDGSVTIHQDAAMLAGLLEKDDQVSYSLAADRKAYLHVARGEVEVNGIELKSGDAAAITQETTLSLSTHTAAEVILFDLA